MLTWAKSSPMSIRAREADYHVSRAVALDTDTGEIGDVFLAWCGKDVIGRFMGATGAQMGRAACAENLKGQPGAVNTGRRSHNTLERSERYDG